MFFIIKNLTYYNSKSYLPAQPINLKNNFDKFLFFSTHSAAVAFVKL